MVWPDGTTTVTGAGSWPNPSTWVTAKFVIGALPAIRWAIAYGVVLTTARSIGEFGAVSVVSGKIQGRTETLPLYVQAQFEQFDVQGAYAASVVLALIAIATVVGLLAFHPREDQS